MPVSGPTDLATALEVRNFSKVTGTPESGWIDFKRIAYATMTERGKWELCKDVAALANADGGCLVLGFEETKDPMSGESVAGAVSPILVSAVNLDQYRALIERGVYPPPSGVEFRWFADGTPPAGVLLINVRSVETERPYVLRRIVSETGENIHALGIPKRNGDRTHWSTAERLHHLLQQAERTADLQPAPPAAQSEDAERAKRRVMVLQEWTDEPIYWLQAIPSGGRTQLPHFYDEVRQALERPGSLRGRGFNLGSLSLSVEVIEGSLVSHRNDAAAWLSPDGLFTVGILAQPSLLGWAINRSPRPNQPMMINSLTLLEMTLEFCRFVWSVLRDRAVADRWTLSVDCQRFKQSRVALPPGLPPQFPPAFPPVATADDWLREIIGTGDAEVDAFDLLTLVYGLFGLPEADIPYSENGRVIADRIKEVK